jgi:iron complex outermembrane receptor protein
MTRLTIQSIAMNLKKILLASTCFSTIIIQSMAFAQTDQAADNAQADSDEIIIEEVVVTGIRSSLDNAAQIKRQAGQMVDAISAEDIGQFSDNNIGEALQRIPGVLLAREAGEGYQISIRGLGPRFVRTTLNGRAALSTSGDENFAGSDARAFSFNVIPSEVVTNVTVSKSTMARDLEGGIGGIVNLQTSRPLDLANRKDQNFYISAAARITYNDLSEVIAPRGSVFLNKKMNDNFAAFLAVVIDDATRQDNTTESQNMRTWDMTLEEGTLVNGEALTEDTDMPLSVFSGVRAIDQPINRDRQTYTGGLQWQSGNWDANFDWTHSRQDEVRVDQRYWQRLDDIRREEQSLTSVTIDFDDANPDGERPTMGTITGFSFENFDRNIVAGAMYRRIPLDSTMNVGGLNVEWSDDVWTIAADVGYADVSTVRTLNRLRSRLDFDNPLYEDVVSGTYDITSGVAIATLYDGEGNVIEPTDISSQGFNRLERTIIEQEGEDISTRFDVTRQVNGGLFDAVYAGFAFNEQQISRRKAEKFVTSGYDLSGVEVVEITDLFSSIREEGFMRDFTAPSIHDPRFQDYLNDPEGYVPDQDEQFDVTESITAGYLQTSFSGKGDVAFRGNVGVRFVKTKQSTVGPVGEGSGDDFTPADPDNPFVFNSRSYTDVLPSFNIAFDVREDVVLRFAANKSVTRPDPIDLTGRLSLDDLEDEEEFTGEGGNPDLQPYGTVSLDGSLEWYPDAGGSYAIGLFYKKLDGWIANGNSPELVTVNGEEAVYDISRPVNTDGGKIKGAELSFHTPFTFASGLLQYFGLNGSVTYVDSKIDAVVPSRGVPISLRGTSKWSGNVIGYFEKDRFSARVAYNFRSDYLHQEAADSRRFDEFTGGQDWIDLNLTYDIRDNIRARFSVNNLTNDLRGRYWGTPGKYFSDLRENGRTFIFELRITN